MIDRIEGHFNKGEWGITKRLASGLLMAEGFSDEEKARAAILGARACLHLREPFSGVKMAESALGFAQMHSNEDLEGRALFVLCGAYVFIGDNSIARLHLRMFIDGLHDRWTWLDEEYGAKAHANLGQVLRSQKLYGDALKHFGIAYDKFESAGHARDQIRTCHQIAWTLTLLEEYEEAQAYMNKATSFGELPPDLGEYHVAHEALLCLYRGDIATAWEKSHEILQRSGTDPGNRAVALYVGADLNRQTGRLAEAKTLAGLARDAATEAGLSHLMTLTNSLLRTLETAKDGA